MITLKDIVDIQGKGLDQIDSLNPDELEDLKQLVFLCTLVISDVGFDKGANYDNVIVNAFRYGLGCGLWLEIKDGKLEKRA